MCWLGKKMIYGYIYPVDFENNKKNRVNIRSIL